MSVNIPVTSIFDIEDEEKLDRMILTTENIIPNSLHPQPDLVLIPDIILSIHPS